LNRIRELLVDLYGCRSDLDNTEFLSTILKAAAHKMGSKVIRKISHKFSPTGITVILILAETHISIHTWPEHRYAALDIFICNEEIDPEIGWRVIEEALKPSSSKIHKLTREIK
jgi:S-adenosylmethionine decarboxylase